MVGREGWMGVPGLEGMRVRGIWEGSGRELGGLGLGLVLDVSGLPLTIRSTSWVSVFSMGSLG